VTDRIAPALREYRSTLTRSASLLPTAESRTMAAAVADALYAEAFELIKAGCHEADLRHQPRRDGGGIDAGIAAAVAG
jgi:hypothetical protein